MNHGKNKEDNGMKVLSDLNGRAKRKPEMSIEEYKERIFRYLTQTQGCSVQIAEALMKKYDEDFQEFYDENYTVEAAGCGMAMNLL